MNSKIFLLLLLSFCGKLFAQNDSGIITYKGAFSRQYRLPYPNDSTVFLNGKGHWQSASGGGVTVPLVLRQDTAFNGLSSPLSNFALKLTSFNSQYSSLSGWNTPNIMLSGNYFSGNDTGFVRSDWVMNGFSRNRSFISYFQIYHYIDSSVLSDLTFADDSANGTATLFIDNDNTGGIGLKYGGVGAWILTFPPSGGSPNQVLTTDGTGVTTWQSILGNPLKDTTGSSGTLGQVLTSQGNAAPAWSGAPTHFIYNNITTGAGTDNKWIEFAPNAGVLTFDPSDTTNADAKWAIALRPGRIKNLSMSPQSIGCDNDTITMTIYVDGVASTVTTALNGHTFYSSNTSDAATLTGALGGVDLISIKFQMHELGLCLGSQICIQFDYIPDTE